jgi:hypothetical protein
MKLGPLWSIQRRWKPTTISPPKIRPVPIAGATSHSSDRCRKSTKNQGLASTNAFLAQRSFLSLRETSGRAPPRRAGAAAGPDGEPKGVRGTPAHHPNRYGPRALPGFKKSAYAGEKRPRRVETTEPLDGRPKLRGPRGHQVNHYRPPAQVSVFQFTDAKLKKQTGPSKRTCRGWLDLPMELGG